MVLLKQIIAIILLSVLVIVSMGYAQQGLGLLVAAHNWVADLLTDVFSGGTAGEMARKLIALLVIPLLVGLVPAVLYGVVKRSWFPYFMQLVWVVWLVQVTALIMGYQTAAA